MKFVSLLVVAVSLVLAPCDAPVKTQPVPGSVALAGDSILWQAILFGQDERANAANSQKLTAPGWEPKHAQAELRRIVADPALSPETVVIAFGQNMADQYGSQERADLFSLIHTAADSSCVVLVLPHPAKTETWVNLTAVRLDMAAAAAQRPNTVAVDWSDSVYSDPTLLALDRVHINVPPDWFAWATAPYAVPAAQSYLNLIWEGIGECD